MLKKTLKKNSGSEGLKSQLETKATEFIVLSNKQVFHINIPKSLKKWTSQTFF